MEDEELTLGLHNPTLDPEDAIRHLNKRYTRSRQNHAGQGGVQNCSIYDSVPRGQCLTSVIKLLTMEELGKDEPGDEVKEDQFADYPDNTASLNHAPLENQKKIYVFENVEYIIRDSEKPKADIREIPIAKPRLSLLRKKNLAQNHTFGEDYLDYGLSRCSGNHYFPANQGICECCGQPPVDLASELSQQQVPYVELLEAKEEEKIILEEKGDDLLEFGLLICRNGHAFHKTLTYCNICGAKSLQRDKDNKLGTQDVFTGEQQNLHAKNILLTPGYFHTGEPKVSASGWTSKYSGRVIKEYLCTKPKSPLVEKVDCGIMVSPSRVNQYFDPDSLSDSD